MKVIESFLRGKRPDQSLCEDGLFIGSQIIAVVDGVTSKGEQRAASVCSESQGETRLEGGIFDLVRDPGREESQGDMAIGSLRNPGREAILPFIKMQCRFENQPGKFGYAVLNGLKFCGGDGPGMVGP